MSFAPHKRHLALSALANLLQTARLRGSHTLNRDPSASSSCRFHGACAMKRFKSIRHSLSAADYRQVMADRFAVWNDITEATTTAAA